MTATLQELPFFYNTTNLSGNDLQVAKSESLKGDEIVKVVFDKYPEQEFTAFEVWQLIQKSGYKTLLTSIRRSCNTLVKNKYIEKTTNKKEGGYGKPNYTFKKI